MSTSAEKMETIKAAANKAAMGLLAGTPCFDEDSGYDEAVLPLLPTMPDDPKGDAKYDFAREYKDVGNRLFKAGEHARALRTYLVGLQLFQRVGYDEPDNLLYDFRARDTCVATFSNGALCALKLERYELAAKLCDAGLRFQPSGGELAKLLLRKAQATLDRPEHADPEAAVELLTRAAKAANSKAIVEMLQRAKQAAKEKKRAAERALFGGRGFDGVRLASNDAGRADARFEVDELLRKGWAALLGTGAEREWVPPELRELHEVPKPEKQPQAAREAFEAAEARATAADIREEAAHAIFGKAAAAYELGELQAAVTAYEDYFSREAGLRAGSGTPDETPPSYTEPQLGAAYGRFQAGHALYQLKEAERCGVQLDGYLRAVSDFRELKICTRDSWGNEVHTELDKETQRQRQWMVCDKCVYPARRMLAEVCRQRAIRLGVASAEAAKEALLSAIDHLRKAREIAPDTKERESAMDEEQTLLAALERMGEVMPHADARAAPTRWRYLGEPQR